MLKSNPKEFIKADLLLPVNSNPGTLTFEGTVIFIPEGASALSIKPS